MSEEKNVGLSAPWVTYFKKIYNLLSVDSEITMPAEVGDEKDGVYSFYVESPNATKIIALSKVLKNEVVMGNITIKIDFRCTNDASIITNDENITAKDYEDAFRGNKYFIKIESVRMPVGSFDYAVFAHEIISFYNDDTSDYHANAHFIVADLVRDIIDPSDVMVCTFYEG